MRAAESRLGDGFRLAAVFGHAHQAIGGGAENDAAVDAPANAADTGVLSDGDGRAARQRHFLQESRRQETDPLPVRREKDSPIDSGMIRARYELGLKLIECASKQDRPPSSR